MRPLRITLVTIAVFQLALGALFVIAPTHAHQLFGLAPAEPGWSDWLFAMMGARFLGFGYGMLVAARDPARHVTWINAMIVIQLIDWIATISHLIGGTVRLSQVSTASFMPVLFIAALLWFHPRRVAAHRG
ncbi:MAG: hypothetical protein HY241_10450 [Actinobacteria bacterium]|nr:hypothetical protein [Actinomycetota bacterium]